MQQGYKKWLIGVPAVAAFFLLGWATAANALTIYGRTVGTWSLSYGYFLNRPGGCPFNIADDVFPGGISTSVRDADSFITTIKNFLNPALYRRQYNTGAAFIIQTMIGTTNEADRRNPPTAAQIADWEARVRYADAKGWVRWGVTFSFTLNSCYQGNDGGPDDDMFWLTPTTRTTAPGGGIEFRDSNNNVVYQIQYSCGNPVGTVSPLPAAPNFTISGRTTVNDPTVYPGQSVSFEHFIRNSGPDSATVGWSSRDGNTNGTLQSGTAGVTGNNEISVNTETFTVPINTPFGTNYCRYVSFSPAVNGLGNGRGATVCAQVVADFELTPTVSPSASTAQQNDSLIFTYAVQNNGPTRSANITCKVAGQNQNPGYVELPQQDNDRNPGVTPQPGLACNQEFAIGNTAVGTETVDVGAAAPGSRICRSLVVNPRNEGGGFRSSAEVCVTIAKSPYVHFMGNDVWAGGGFAAVAPACNAGSKIQTVAHTLRDGTVAGSATEYGAFALGKILTFGSGNRALVNPSGVTGKSLTFSNRDSNNLGYFGAAQHCINDYVANYDKATNDAGYPAAIDVGSQPNGTRLNLSGPRSFSGTLVAGSQQIYLVEGNVTITGDIKYPTTYNSLNQIPSLIIIATGTITVNRDVQQIDGLFVNRGQFFTCDVAANAILSVNPPCEKQLTINGSVITGRLQLLRTFGAEGGNEAQRKRPAEIFNFNSELYLRSALSGGNANILRTVDQKDLPPRF